MNFNPTINEVALDLLLVFYAIYYKEPERLESLDIQFLLANRNISQPTTVVPSNDISSELSNRYDASLLYNALHYLKNESLLNYNLNKETGGSRIFHSFSLTSNGVNLVESVSQISKQQNPKIFNVTIKNNITIDGLIQLKVGDLLHCVFG